ncbi:restriction endonuclease subunit S [Endozoicomonas sp.]|uniref:restriction endonuclease subunit S n=1 Tax=Endozoicomonas sp. TaxID=1892382 RepID=UPI00383A1F3E
MVNDWKEVSLTDIYEIRSGLSKPAKDFGPGYPFLSFKDVFYNFFAPDELSQLVQSNEKERIGCSVKKGDVFLTRTSETMHELGMSCVALKDYDNATFNGFCKRLRPKDSNNAVPEYVGYYLRSQKFRNEMLAFSTMSTRASLNNEMISKLKISLPSVQEQEFIAHVLKTLDNKIQLNRQTNQTLEAMAQALFKSWFVDFDQVIDNALAAGNEIPEPLQARAEQRKTLYEGDALLASRIEKAPAPLPEHILQLFPSSFVFDADMGWIPEGWEIKTIGNMLDLAYGKSLPATNREPGPFPVYGSGGVSGYHKEAICNGPGVVVGRKGTVGSVYWVSQDFFPIDTVFYVKPKVKMPLFWVFQKLSHMNIATLSADSAVPGVNRNAIYTIKWVIPSEQVLEEYFELLSPTIKKQTELSVQNESLVKIRDTLLPKLISGELLLPSESMEAQQQTEAAVA